MVPLTDEGEGRGARGGGHRQRARFLVAETTGTRSFSQAETQTTAQRETDRQTETDTVRDTDTDRQIERREVELEKFILQGLFYKDTQSNTCLTTGPC